MRRRNRRRSGRRPLRNGFWGRVWIVGKRREWKEEEEREGVRVAVVEVFVVVVVGGGIGGR